MYKVSTRNYSLIAEALDSEIGFQSYGALRASFDSHPTRGSLPAEWFVRLLDDMAASGGEMFILYSYKTPIAWRTSSGEVVVPPVRYSVTTSKHQGHAHGWVMRNREAVSA